MKILRLLFSPADASIAKQLPTSPMPLETLSKGLDIPHDDLESRLTDMAQRGLVLDLERYGRRYFALPPVVVGFFEFTFMRTRDDLPMEVLARLYEEYMREDDRFARSIFQGETQVGRSLVREESLPDAIGSSVLDWERASRIIQSARCLAISLCACRHKAAHLGQACEAPMKTCLSFNTAAEMLIRQNIAEATTVRDAMAVLEESKAHGLVQIGDNVQRDVGYLCNCCSCCCGMIQAIRTFDIRNAIVTSNWSMEIDKTKCTGCGKCITVCPLDAISFTESAPGEKRAKCEEDLCLGCGVCYQACNHGAISMKPRPERVFTPETVYDRMIAMAIERGKLADLIFSAPQSLSHRALGRILAVIEKCPPYKALVAIRPLRSTFLNALVRLNRSSPRAARRL
jgi:ferredoxin